MCETRPMDSNVAELLSRAATQEPDKTILSEAATGRTVTCSGLEELVQRVVQGLDDAGMVAGYRVMIASGNRIEFVAAYLGALRAGMVVVPVNPRSATGELIRMLADSGTRMVIADGDTVSTVRAAVDGLGEAMEAAGYEATHATADRHRRHHALARRAQLGPARRDSRRAFAPAGRPREPGGPALHQRHLRASARGDAVPPGAAGEHRAGGPGDADR